MLIEEGVDELRAILVGESDGELVEGEFLGDCSGGSGFRGEFFLLRLSFL